MVGFRDFDGVGIAPVSNKMAVKVKFIAGYTKNHSLPSNILPFRSKTITKIGNESVLSVNLYHGKAQFSGLKGLKVK